MAENIEYGLANLKYGIYTSVFDQQFDLVINATGSRFVDLVFENEMKQYNFECPIVSCSISAKAKYGLLITRMPKFRDGLETIIREAKIKTHFTEKLQPYSSAIWPVNPEATTFQPEPGCSEPTFVASAIDMSWYASTFLNTAITDFEELPDESARVQFFSQEKFAVSQVNLDGSSICKKDQRFDFTTILYPTAKDAIESVIANCADSEGKLKETGGLLFGEINEILQTVWIDFASEPPIDSQFSELCFICGKEGTQELDKYYSEKTKGSTEFIGTWHTHPISEPTPSEIDLNAVKSIFESNKHCRKLLLLIIGNTTTNPNWEFYLFKRSEIEKSLIKY